MINYLLKSEGMMYTVSCKHFINNCKISLNEGTNYRASNADRESHQMCEVRLFVNI